MPDMTQHGKAETQQWQPVENTPVVMFDRVSKTYGRINALSGVSIGLSGGVTGILGMTGSRTFTLFHLMQAKIKPSSGPKRPFGTDPWTNPSPYSSLGFVPAHAQP